MDSIQAYVGKQHSMLPVGIRSCDIPFSHRDGKVRAPTFHLLEIEVHHDLVNHHHNYMRRSQDFPLPVPPLSRRSLSRCLYLPIYVSMSLYVSLSIHLSI